MLEIITGRSGIGKTSHCLTTYRQALLESASQGNVGEVLWLSPTHRTAQNILNQLLSDELRCCLSPGVMTFEQFAERVLRGTGTAASLVNQTQRRMLLKSVIEEAEQAHELVHFRQISQTNGFVSQLGRFIAELKREETWPEDWLKAFSAEKTTSKDRELGNLYQRYQDHLLRWDKYDSEGRFWRARSELAQGHWQAFPRLSLVVVDGFTDFSSTQQEMLIMLARHSQKLVVTLPGEPDSETGDTNRLDLFHRSTESRQQLILQTKKQNIPCTLTWLNPQKQTAAKPAGLEILSSSLFANPRSITPATTAQGIQCLSSLGPKAEVREVGKQVKQLLLQGIPAKDILVTVRQLENYAISIRSLWSDAGIPHLLDLDDEITYLPLTRAISSLYRTMREDWSFSALKKLLRQTPLNLPGQKTQDERSQAVLRALRIYNLRGSRTEILDRLQAELINQGKREQQVDEENDILSPTHDSSEASLALDTLQLLDQSLKNLRRTATYSDHTQQLLATARELFFSSEEISSSTSASQQQRRTTQSRFGSLADQWDLLAGLLKDASAFQDLLLEGKKPKVGWQQYADWLEEQFRFQSLPPRKATTGEVLVLESNDARHLEVPYLFIMGLHEGSFPGRSDNQPFYNESERQNWNERGIPLNNRNSHHREEMQYFYRLVMRAQHQLTLSYSRVTSTGGPQYSCSFYQTLRSLFLSETLPETPVGSLSPIPELGQLLTRTDCRLQAVSDMHHDSPGLLAWWAEQPSLKESFWSLMSVARMNSHRFEQAGFTAYEGMLRSGANQQYLQAYYHSEYAFSASRLESYANCPFRYFLESVLKVDSLQAPKLATDHLSRGNLIHDLLAELHDEAGQDLLVQLDRNETSRGLAEKYLELLEQRFQKKFKRSDLQAALDDIEIRLLTEWADLYHDQTSKYLEEISTNWKQIPVPRYREISFGKNREDSERSDAGQNPELPPVYFGKSDPKIKVEGRIDRIDVGHVDGRDVFTIIDYKTGLPPSVREQHVLRGTQLQLALYVVAVIRLKLLGEDAIPWLAGYWGIREQGFQPQFKTGNRRTVEPLTELFLEKWEQVLDQLIPHMVDCIRQGEFPVHNEDKNCTGRCPYRTVCRVNQVRAVSEPLLKTWSLQISDEQASRST